MTSVSIPLTARYHVRFIYHRSRRRSRRGERIAADKVRHTGLTDLKPNGVPGGAARRSPCVHSRGAGRHARRWCKSLNPSALTRRLARNDAFFHKLFHSFCGFPPDGFAFPSSGDDPGCRTTAGDRARLALRAGKCHKIHYLSPWPAPRTRLARRLRRPCGKRSTEVLREGSRPRGATPESTARARTVGRTAVQSLPACPNCSPVRVWTIWRRTRPAPRTPQRLETPRGRADFLGVGTGAEHGALRRVRRRPRQRPQACAAPGGGVCAVETWTASQARLGGNRSRRRRLSGYRGTESSRSLSARSHQTDPKLTNGPPSIAMRVRTW